MQRIRAFQLALSTLTTSFASSAAEAVDSSLRVFVSRIYPRGLVQWDRLPCNVEPKTLRSYFVQRVPCGVHELEDAVN